MLPHILKKIRIRINKNKIVSWHGDYSNWESAKLACGDGYNEQEIIDTVANATRKVVSGQAVYERDSVTFNQIEYSWPLATAVTWAAARAQGNLRVVDFGGALGSSYRQNQKFLQGLPAVKWVVVEQSAFVTIGEREFSNEELMFEHSLDNAIANYKPNLIMAPSVLQYLEKPFEWVEKIAHSGADIVIFDRTSISLEGRCRLTVQHIPSSIYKAKYPCWILDENALLQLMLGNYELVTKFASAFNSTFDIDGKTAACEAGFLFRKR